METQAKIDGTPETNDVVDFICKGYTVLKKAEADGKIDWTDAALLLELVPLIGPAISGAEKVPAELLDLDSAEGSALLARIAKDLGETPEKAKLIVEGSIQMLLGGLKVVQGWKA